MPAPRAAVSSVVLCVDSSGSMAAFRTVVERQIQDLFSLLAVTENSRIRVLTFADSVFEVLKETEGRCLPRTIDFDPHGGTALYDAVMTATSCGASAVYLFTDGEDNASSATHAQCLEHLRSYPGRLMAYAPTIAKEALSELGFEVKELNFEKDFSQSFEEMTQEISQCF